MGIQGNNTVADVTKAKTLNSRIALKIDTWQNWSDTSVANKKGNLVLHAGEIAFVQMGTVPPVGENKPDTGAYDVLFKVGDGNQAFKDLPWGSAKAADVYAWAKVASANDVTISYGSGDSVKSVTLGAFLQDFETYKTTNDSAITSINGSLEELSGKVAGLEGLVGGDTNFATKDYVNTSVSDAKKELLGTSTSSTVATTIAGASDKAEEAKSVADAATVSAKTANDWITEHEKVKHITVDEMNTAISTADSQLEAKLVGNDTTDNTIKYAIKQAVAAQTAADEAAGAASDAATVAARAEDKVDTLIGSDANKSARTIANEELAKQLVAEGAKESLNTLAEIAAWIQSHPDDAAELNRLLSGLGTTGEGEAAKAKTVKEYVDGVVSAEQTARTEAITNAVNALDVDEVAVGAGKTLASIKQVDGKIETSSVDIAITKSQVTDFNEDDYATAGHDHDQKYADKVATEAHIAKAVTEETYLLIDCGTSTINVD